MSDISKYPEHVQRMIKEQIELSARTRALEKFITTNPLYQKLDDQEQLDMSRQCHAMQDYEDNLISRLCRANYSPEPFGTGA
jgi:hypothetical protein